jgi:hypothetical protein
MNEGEHLVFCIWIPWKVVMRVLKSTFESKSIKVVFVSISIV